MRPPVAAAAALLLALATALPAAAAPCPGAVCIDTIEVDGKPATLAAGVSLRGPKEAQDRKLTVTAGQVLDEGTTLETPMRPAVVLKLLTKAGGNTITLSPGARLSLEKVGAKGESFVQRLGDVRYAVVRALGFFEVKHDHFLAAVKGTEFAVLLDPQLTEIRYRWFKGEVLIEQQVPVLVQGGDRPKGAPAETGEPPAADEDADEPRDDAPVAVERKVLSAATPELSFRLNPDQYLRRFNTFGDAEQFFRDQLAADERSGDPRRIRQGQLMLAHILGVIGKPRAALEMLQRVADQAAADKDDALEAMLARRLGFAYRALGDWPGYVAAMQRRLAIEQRRAPGGVSPAVAMAHIGFGRALGLAGDPRAWVHQVELGLAMHRQIDPNEERQAIAAATKNLADAQWAAGERQAALANYRKTLALKQKLAPSGVSVPLANGWRDLGLRTLELGDPAGAAELLQKALDTRRALLKQEVHPAIAFAWDDLGRARERGGDWAGANAAYRQALQMRQQLFPDGEHPSLVRSWRNLLRVARASGDTATAAQATARLKELRAQPER